MGRYGLNVEDFDFSAARVTASVHDSLERLQTDRLDLVYCHDVEFGDLDQVGRWGETGGGGVCVGGGGGPCVCVCVCVYSKTRSLGTWTRWETRGRGWGEVP